MTVDLDVVTTDAQFLALEDEWNELLQNSVANTIFLTWEWVSTWWQWFGDDYQLWMVTAREKENGRLLGIAPLVWRRYLQSNRIPYRELLFIGSNQAAPDHLDFIVHENKKGHIDDALIEFVWENRQQWDFIHFDSLRSNSLALAKLADLADSRWQETTALSCPAMALPENWDLFEQTLGKNLRKNLKRYDRALAKQGNMVYKVLTEQNEVDDAISDLRRLHQAVRQGHGDAGAFKDPRMEPFQKQVAKRFLQKDWLRFHSLHMDDQMIGVTYNFFYNNVFSYYMTGYDLSWSRFGPGRQIIGHAVRQAIENEASVFDFLRGDEAYKLSWGAEMLTTQTIKIAISWRAKLLMRVRELKANLRSRKEASPTTAESSAAVSNPSP